MTEMFTPELVAERAAKARAAQVLWRRYDLNGRMKCVLEFWNEVKKIKDRLQRVMREESGAPKMEIEVDEHNRVEAVIHHYTRHAHRILEDRHVARPWIFLNKRTFVRSVAHGVVSIVSSRSLPLLAPLADALLALIAGNVVLIKPGSWAVKTSLFLENVARSSGILPEDAFQVIPGPDAAGLEALKESDMTVFTGSFRVAREMAMLAAQQMKPIILESGEKHSMIVFNDAPLDRAVKSAVWGAFSHAGQSPLNVQRVFVESGAYPSFSKAVTEEAAILRTSVEYSDDVDVGRLICTDHLEKTMEHIRDAKDKGARVIGGEVLDAENLLLSPAVILDASVEMKVLQEETPGPVLAIMVARSGEEALRLANQNFLGLSASLWSRDVARAETWSACLEYCLVSINDSSSHDRICSLPYGAMKGLGSGHRHADEGLRMFCRPQSVLVHEWPLDAAPWRGFPYDHLKRRVLSLLNRFA